MSTAQSPATDIPGLSLFENLGRDEGLEQALEMTRSAYPHEQVYGTYCTLHGYTDAPAPEVFAYLSDVRSLSEWTYSLRDFTRTDDPDLWRSHDRLGGEDTDIYTRVTANADAMTVDYHCAWDQGEHLWMIYLMRVIPAPLVFDKPGSVLLWTNCKHPFYEKNPFPELAPPGRELWVGDVWPLFYAGHQMELDNLTTICAFRHTNGLPVAPDWDRVTG